MAQYTLDLYPQSLIDLNKELAHHPEVWPLMEEHPVADWPQRFGAVAAYCGIGMDEMYHPKDLENLAELLTKKLFEKRTSIILPVN